MAFVWHKQFHSFNLNSDTHLTKAKWAVAAFGTVERGISGVEPIFWLLLAARGFSAPIGKQKKKTEKTKQQKEKDCTKKIE